ERLAGYEFPTAPASMRMPETARTMPATRPSQWPIGMVFSNNMKPARPAIQNRFMMPPKNSRPIRNQQHPKQGAVLEPHAKGAEPARPPTLSKKTQWRAAMPQAHRFDRGELPYAG